MPQTYPVKQWKFLQDPVVLNASVKIEDFENIIIMQFWQSENDIGPEVLQFNVQ